MGFLTKNIIRPQRLEMIKREIKPEWKIIDLAMGDGWLTKALKQEGYDCEGLPWLENPLPYRDNEFECSILVEAIEHLIPELIPEIERITKRKIIITTIVPGTLPLCNLLIWLKMIVPYPTPHIKEYKLEDIPFKKFRLVRRKKHWVIDQFGVFEAKR